MRVGGKTRVGGNIYLFPVPLFRLMETLIVLVVASGASISYFSLHFRRLGRWAPSVSAVASISGSAGRGRWKLLFLSAAVYVSISNSRVVKEVVRVSATARQVVGVFSGFAISFFPSLESRVG